MLCSKSTSWCSEMTRQINTLEKNCNSLRNFWERGLGSEISVLFSKRFCPAVLFIKGWQWRSMWINCNRGGGYSSYILLNEIQTLFSQLAKQSARVLPADLCIDHVHFLKNHRSTVLRRNKNVAVQGGTVSYYIFW